MANIDISSPSGSSELPGRRRIGRRTYNFGLLLLVFLVIGIAAPCAAGTLQDINSRQHLVCGISDGVPGFSEQVASGAWQGLDVDFCRAVATAILGKPGNAKFVPLRSDERFSALSAGQVDILTRNTSWTMAREIELKLIFPGILYFDGQGFLVPRELGLTSPLQLAEAKVCVLVGTTSQTNAADYFARNELEVELVKFSSRVELLKSYQAGSCDAYTTDRAALFGDLQDLEDPSSHMILPQVISKEPLAPVVRLNDRKLADIVRWTLAALISAEELGLTRESLRKEDPEFSIEQRRFIEKVGGLGTQLGLKSEWLWDVVLAVGNYGEMFERNLGKGSPIGMTRGANALWSDGGLMYAPPMP